MKRLALYVTLLVATGFLFVSRVSANSDLLQQLPLSCDPSKGVYTEMSALVVIPLDQKVIIQPGESDSDIVKSVFYDFVYARVNKMPPINALAVNGSMYDITCNLPDYQANVTTGIPAGVYIIGSIGALPKAEVQKIIEYLKLKTFYRADIAALADPKTTTVGLTNMKACGDICEGLTLPRTPNRVYTLKIQGITFSRSVRQQEQVALSISVKNESAFPIYGAGSAPLHLITTKSGLSPLYHSSWISLGDIVRNSGTLLPGGETTLSATLGSPLKPGSYSETFQLRVGNSIVDKSVPVSFTVENDNLLLGRIISKDTKAPYANFRATPSLKGDVIGRLDAGTYVIIKGYQDAWVKIETKEGRAGWVYKPFIRVL